MLTGATGFIGSRVARDLVERGHEVHALVRDTRRNVDRLEGIRDQVRFVAGDVLDRASVTAAIRGIRPELCVHMAWYAVPGLYLSDRVNTRLLCASIDLATELAAAGCRRLVATGTCFEYDTSVGTLSEDSPIRPGFLYSACKHALYEVLGRLGELDGFSFAWPRIFYQYGPYEDARRLVPSVIRSLLTGESARVSSGEQVRDYLHVDDVASGICEIALTDRPGAFNVGSGKPVQVRTVVATIGDVCGRPDLIAWGAAPRAPGDPEFVCADVRRLMSETSWSPRFGLEDGIRDTVEWWRARIHREVTS